MKKIHLIALSVLYFSLFQENLFAKDSFFIEGGMISAYRNGYITEYVYDKSKSAKLSQLDWNIKNSFQLGGVLKFGFPYIDLGLSATGTIPSDSGRMYDSDWLNLNDTIVDYSVNENEITNGLSLGVKLNGKIPLFKKFTIMPSLLVNFEKVHFETSNIEGWYGDRELSGGLIQKRSSSSYVSYTDPTAIHYPDCGTKLASVDYESNNLYTWLGGDFKYTPFEKLSVYCGAYFSPFIYHFSIDTHWKNAEKTIVNKYYMDEIFSNFNAFKLETCVSYSPIKNLFINAEFSWTRFYKTLGDTYTSTSKSSGYTIDSSYNSGADSNYITVSLFVTYRFLQFKGRNQN